MESSQTSKHAKSDFLAEKQLFDKALLLKDQGFFEEAIEILLDIAERHPTVGATFGILGGIFNELQRFSEAEVFFRKATKNSPTSELASRGLFHSLWDQGKVDEAVQELKRYIGTCGSEEFQKMVNDIENWRNQGSGDGE